MSEHGDDAGNVMVNPARVTLPKFTGDETDPTVVLDFIEKVDDYQGLVELSNAQTAQAVRFAFKPDSTAAMWIRNARNDPEHGAECNAWSTLKPLMKTRFCGKLNASQEASLTKDLKQHKGEKASRFYDRCLRAVDLLSDLSDVERVLPSHIRGRLQQARRTWLAGLSNENKLNEKMADEATKEADITVLVKTATSYESNMSTKQPVQIEEIYADGNNDNDDELTSAKAGDTPEVAFLRLALKKSKKTNYTKQQSNLPRKNAPGPDGVETRRCYNCNKVGHLSANCREPRKQKNNKGQKGKKQNYGPGNGGGDRKFNLSEVADLVKIMNDKKEQTAQVDALNMGFH